MTDRTVYLDYNSTTPVAPEVVDEMLPWMTSQFWNASSSHQAGRRALVASDIAREEVADFVGVRPGDVIFTSGATEANNMVIKGLRWLAARGRTRAIVAATEHKSVLEAAALWSEVGELVIVPAMTSGLIDESVFADALDDRVAFVSLMLANNETGVIAPIAQLAEMAHEVGAVVHSDVTQAGGKLAVDLSTLGIDVASLSAHKMYGPKGVGALVARRGIDIDPLLHGGGHERGLRSGTLNIPGIVGMAAAARLTTKSMVSESVRQSELVDALLGGLTMSLPDADLIGATAERLPNTACVRFRGADAEAVMANAPTLAISAGSACTSLVPSPSHVLRGMGFDEIAASECLRFSVGRMTTGKDIEDAVGLIASAVKQVRDHAASSIS